jgi:hypothetical protein
MQVRLRRIADAGTAMPSLRRHRSLLKLLADRRGSTATAFGVGAFALFGTFAFATDASVCVTRAATTVTVQSNDTVNFLICAFNRTPRSFAATVQYPL